MGRLAIAVCLLALAACFNPVPNGAGGEPPPIGGGGDDAGNPSTSDGGNDAGVDHPAKKLQSIWLTRRWATLAIGTSATFSAAGNYDDGSVADVSDQVSWSVEQRWIAKVVAGKVTAAAAGK